MGFTAKQLESINKLNDYFTNDDNYSVLLKIENFISIEYKHDEILFKICVYKEYINVMIYENYVKTKEYNIDINDDFWLFTGKDIVDELIHSILNYCSSNVTIVTTKGEQYTIKITDIDKIICRGCFPKAVHEDGVWVIRFE